MKSFVFVMLFTTSCLATPINQNPSNSTDQAIQLLIKSHDLFVEKQYREATALDLTVLEMKSIPDDIKSAAFILMGNIAMSTGNLVAARVAYKHVLDLKKAPRQDKISAAQGIRLVDDFQRDEQRRHTTPSFH